MSNDLNHHNDPTGLAASAAEATGARPYLGDVNDIDHLLRQFTEGVTSRFAQVGRGQLAPDAAAEADRAECLRMAEVFDGQDDAYATIENWNGEGLANYIRARMAESVQPDEDDEQIIAQAFALFVHRIYGAITAAGASPDQDALVAALQDNIRSFTWLLVGLESNE
jgi:ferredoxin